jgi:rhomboid family GlyGly-CTERM serine protease
MDKAMRRISRRWELVAWSIILMVLHVPLLSGGSGSALAFFPDRFASGEWWRLLTHPFVHVSWYHLFLDGAAFLFLWHGQEGALRTRLGTVVASAAGSLLFAALGSREFWSIGLCGLSGVAHGLMTRQAIDLCGSTDSPPERRLGLTLLVGVMAKCIFEAVTGGALFGHWHFGNIGTPIVICHLGGVFGALAFKLAECRFPLPQSTPRISG